MSAKDKATAKEQRITITASSGLAKDEVERLIQEAELHAQDDQQKREEVEVRNQADTMAYNAEKTLRENADKVSDELKTEVQDKVTAVRQAMASEDVAATRAAVEELSASMNKIGEAIYQQQAASAEQPESTEPKAEAADGADGDEPSSEEKPDDTVEGEYREV